MAGVPTGRVHVGSYGQGRLCAKGGNQGLSICWNLCTMASAKMEICPSHGYDAEFESSMARHPRLVRGGTKHARGMASRARKTHKGLPESAHQPMSRSRGYPTRAHLRTAHRRSDTFQVSSCERATTHGVIKDWHSHRMGQGSASIFSAPRPFRAPRSRPMTSNGLSKVCRKPSAAPGNHS